MKIAKFALILAACVVVLVAAFYFLAPVDRVEGAKATFRRLFDDQGQSCFDLWSNSLKDEKSAQLVSSTRLDGEIVVQYRATNSFGAYVSDHFNCPLSNGQVDRTAVVQKKSERALENFRQAND